MDRHPAGDDRIDDPYRSVPLPGILLYVRERGPDGALVDIRGDGEGTVGYPLESLRDDPRLLQRRVHPDDVGEVREALDALSPDDRATLAYRVRSRDGGDRWVRDTFRLRAAPAGRPDRVVGALRTIGVERSLREQVAALEARIWKSQRMDSLGSLAAGVAHDFNNLLTAILSSVQLLEDEALTTAGRADLALIRDAANRGARMVRQILRFARRGDSFAPTNVDVAGTLESLRPILERSLGTGCELRLRVAPDLPTVRCDTGQLEQIVLNLVVNARDAMPTGGSVRITVEPEALEEDLETEDRVLPPGEYVVVTVRDRGKGIPDEVRERIFEPFFTTKSGDAAAGGGFGLPTVQRIVRGYGGGVTVETEPGRGTAFGIWLPVDPSADAGALPTVNDPAPEAMDGVRVLVAEADPEVREAVARVLGRDGHAVVAVGSAAEALRAFDRGGSRPELAVVASVLPDRYGEELVEALRSRASDLPVVLVSGRAPGEEDVSDDRRTVRLVRPFTPDQLRAAVARALDDRDRRGPTYQPLSVQ